MKTLTLRIDLLSPRLVKAVLPPPPPGVRMSGLQSAPANGPMMDSFFIILEITKPIASGILARFIYERVAQYDAKRKRIQDQEVSSEADFERVISELEIGKND